MRVPNLIIGLALVASLLAYVPAPAAQADEPCSGETCATADDFESDIDGWEIAEPGTVAEWQASQTFAKTCQWWEFGCQGYSSTASGVMAVHINPPMTYIEMPAAKLKKWVDLTPGTYKVITRFSSDPMNLANPSRVTTFSVGVRYNNTTTQELAGRGWSNTSRQFTVFESSTFTVDRSVSAELEAAFSYAPPEHTVHIDYIWLVRVSTDYPTPNPAMPTLPAYATPPPLPAEVCRTLQPTPTPGAFSLTPTPVPPARFYDHESFNAGTGNWGTLAGSVSWVSTPNHGNSLDLGAVRIAYSDNGDPVTSRAALAFGFTPVITAPVYLNGFVRANDAILAGVSAYLQVHALENDIWSMREEHQLGYGRWQPFHTDITTGTIQALALTVRRSDSNITQTVTLDDLTVYNSFDSRPLCSSYNGSASTVDANEYPQPDVYGIVVPIDRECPPASLDVPNNFWGPLLAGLTVFLDRLTAPFPGHTPGSTTSAARELSQAPVWNFLAIIAGIWDLRPLLAGAGVILAIEGVRAVWSLWIFIKRTVPFLGG